jgi:hypothetical protein
MPDYPLTPWLYLRFGGNQRAADGKCSVRADDQTPGNAQEAKAVNRVTMVKDAGTRLRNCAKPALGVSRRYKVNSCSRPIPLGYRPKRYAKSAFAAPARQALP